MDWARLADEIANIHGFEIAEQLGVSTSRYRDACMRRRLEYLGGGLNLPRQAPRFADGFSISEDTFIVDKGGWKGRMLRTYRSKFPIDGSYFIYWTIVCVASMGEA
ncbi:hypothetical protein [Novosphingobium sp. 9]|uniref:hypothetical protein n=1 Tax=Novosphingobium sp. 9 TaxID=2025349 RepID=UPI0021B5EEEE|nr:hypothetical protein [Novosphingobium sp. 9]